MLVNALYLRAPWADEFNAHLTKNERFLVHGRDGAEVPMMAGHASELGYAKRNGFQVVTRPYDGFDLQFVILLPGARLADARRTAENVRRALAAAEVVTRAGETVSVTASFGVSEFPTYANAEALLAAADAALYQAKRGGKNQVATAMVQAQGATDEPPRGLASPVGADSA